MLIHVYETSIRIRLLSVEFVKKAIYLLFFFFKLIKKSSVKRYINILTLCSFGKSFGRTKNKRRFLLKFDTENIKIKPKLYNWVR